MREPIEFLIPGKAVAWARARINPYGFHYTNDKTRAYEKMVGTLAGIAMRGGEMIEGAVSVDIAVTLSPPTALPKRVRELFMAETYPAPTGADVDNFAKAIFDGMNDVVFKDDRQVARLTVSKSYGREPHVLVRVSELMLPDFPA